MLRKYRKYANLAQPLTHMDWQHDYFNPRIFFFCSTAYVQRLRHLGLMKINKNSVHVNRGTINFKGKKLNVERSI